MTIVIDTEVAATRIGGYTVTDGDAKIRVEPWHIRKLMITDEASENNTFSLAFGSDDDKNFKLILGVYLDDRYIPCDALCARAESIYKEYVCSSNKRGICVVR